MSVCILMILRSVRSHFLAVVVNIGDSRQHRRVVDLSYVNCHILKQLIRSFLLLQNFLLFLIIF